MHKVFYSWQANTEEKNNRYLIRDALDKAIKTLALDLELDEATRGQPGSPMIFEAICVKIAACAMFVPDVTLVGRSHDGRKLLPNPNVLVEYGYALAKVGEVQIVPVMNLAFGQIEELPFDLRHRVIRLAYHLAPETTPEERNKERDHLAGRLAAELRLVFENALFGGLSRDAVRIVQFLSERSEHGVGGRGEHKVAELASVLGLDAAEVNTLLSHLAARGYVERSQVLGTDAPPAIPTDKLFWDFDRLLRRTDPKVDAKTVAQAMVTRPGQGVNCAALMQELGWEVRRMNPPLRLLAKTHLVLASGVRSFPLAVASIRKNERTEAFLSGLIDPS